MLLCSFANYLKSQIRLLERQQLSQISVAPATTPTVRISKALVRAARRDKIGREVESEPFSKWRAKQLEKMKNQDAFPTQVVWYVGTTFALKA